MWLKIQIYYKWLIVPSVMFFIFDLCRRTGCVVVAKSHRTAVYGIVPAEGQRQGTPGLFKALNGSM